MSKGVRFPGPGGPRDDAAAQERRAQLDANLEQQHRLGRGFGKVNNPAKQLAVPKGKRRRAR